MLSAAGRMMRCAECAYTWWHHPHSAPTPQHIQAQALAQQAAAAPQAPAPMPIPEPEPEPEEEEEFEEPETEESEDPELSDEEIPEPEPEPEEEEEFEEPETEESEDPELSDEEIEEAFGTEEPDSIESMTDAPAKDDDGSEIDPDKIPDPEPLPESLTNPGGGDEDENEDEDEEEGESRIGLIIAAVAGGLLLVTLAVFLLMSQQIASWIPGMSSVYESIGLNKKILGEGLRIPNNKLQSERIPGKDSETLIVRGVIRNITKEQLALPMVRLSLFNGEGKVVQTKVIKPRAPVLAGNKSIGFEIKMKDPAATARRIEVTFSEPMKGGPAAKPKADEKKKK
jgi:hypothetical protein